MSENLTRPVAAQGQTVRSGRSYVTAKAVENVVAELPRRRRDPSGDIPPTMARTYAFRIMSRAAPHTGPRAPEGAECHGRCAVCVGSALCWW